MGGRNDASLLVLLGPIAEDLLVLLGVRHHLGPRFGEERSGVLEDLVEDVRLAGGALLLDRGLLVRDRLRPDGLRLRLRLLLRGVERLGLLADGSA